MELGPRLDVIKSCGLTTESGYEDLLTIIRVFKEEFGIELTEENAGVLITHIATAFKRAGEDEKINPLDASIVEDIKQEPEYPRALEIVNRVQQSIINELSDTERDFMLVHVVTLLYAEKPNNH